MASIKILVDQLETEINNRMSDFVKLGQETKQLLLNGSDSKLVFENYHKMATIFSELRPVECTVRELYPQYERFFDALLILSHAAEQSLDEDDDCENE